MSPRISRSRAVRRARAAPRGARGPASAPSDRCRPPARRRAPAESTGGRCRTRVRAPGRRPAGPPCARTARRGVPASARFPSRRTARSRPSRRGPRGRTLGLPDAGSREPGAPVTLPSGQRWQRASCAESRRTGRRPRAIRPDTHRAREGTPRRWCARSAAGLAASACSTGFRRAVHTSSRGQPSCTFDTGNRRTSSGSMPAAAHIIAHLGSDGRIRRLASRGGQGREEPGGLAERNHSSGQRAVRVPRLVVGLHDHDASARRPSRARSPRWRPPPAARAAARPRRTWSRRCRPLNGSRHGVAGGEAHALVVGLGDASGGRRPWPAPDRRRRAAPATPAAGRSPLRPGPRHSRRRGSGCRAVGAASRRGTR